MVLKEVEDRTFYYRMESIKLVDKDYEFDFPKNARQMEVVEDYDVQQADQEGDYYRSVLKIQIFICDKKIGNWAQEGEYGISFTRYRRNMA